MITKKYTGSSIEEIEGRIDKDLGPSAVIMMTRLIQKGMLQQFFLEDEYEVTAVIDEEDFKLYRALKSEKLAEDKRRKDSLPFNWEEINGKIVTIPVTGPLYFDPIKQNVLILVGFDTKDKAIAIAKLAVKLRQNTPFNTEIISIKGVIDSKEQPLTCLCAVFDIKHTLCENAIDVACQIKVSDTNSIILVNIPFEYETEKVVEVMPQNSYYQKHLIFNTNTNLSVLDRFHHLDLKGVIISIDEENPSLIPLIGLTEQYHIPVSYLSEGSKFTLAQSDELEISITNERLRTVR